MKKNIIDIMPSDKELDKIKSTYYVFGLYEGCKLSAEEFKKHFNDHLDSVIKKFEDKLNEIQIEEKYR